MKSFKEMFTYVFFATKMAFMNAKALFVAFILISLILSIESQLQGYVLGNLVDASINTDSIKNSEFLNAVAITALFFFIRQLLFIIFDFVDRKYSIKGSNENDLRMLANNLTLPAGIYEDADFIKQKIKVDYNLWKVNNLVYRITGVLDSLLPLVIAISVFFKYDVFIVLLLVVSVIPQILIKIKFGKASWSIWDVFSEDKIKYQQYRHRLYTDDPNTFHEIKVFGFGNYLLKRVRDVHSNFLNRSIGVEKKRAFSLFFANSWEVIFLTSSIIRLFSLLVSGSITVGNFYFILSLMLGLKWAITGGFNSIVNMLNDLPFFESLYKYFHYSPKFKVHTGIDQITSEKMEIELKDVWFKYPGTNRWVLKGVNLKIPEGKDVALVGKNGSGKTTLIKLILGVYVVDKGQILINGKDIRTLKIDDYYKKIGFLSQEFVSCGIPAWENIYLGNVEAEENMDKIIEAAKSADADEFISKYPKGYDTYLTREMEDGVIPSGGQLQRIAIARVFFRNPELILLDEPTSAIDALAEEEIFNNLKDFAKDKSVLIVSHRFATVKKADYIYVLDGGTIVEEGTHEKLAVKSGLYSEMYQAQES